MKAPRILISISVSGGINYENALISAGAVPAAGYCPVWDGSCDGLILAGGDDIDPVRFGQPNQGSLGIDPARDQAELDLVAACLAAGKPILGICRGHQLLNVALGGDLIQDLGAEDNLFHRRDPGSDHDKVHPIRTSPGSLLERLYGPLCVVNSSHHQAVDRLGEGLIATAWSESGVVEGIEHASLPLLGVQFHPERMGYARRRPDTADSSFLMEHFIGLCR